MVGRTTEEIDVSSQLDRLRAALGLALGQTQDVRVPGLDVDDINSSLAQAVREIYAIQKEGIGAAGSSKRINRAMEHMRHTLMLLQDIRVENPALSLATGTIARILAMLYPMSKALEKAEAARRQIEAPAPIARKEEKAPAQAIQPSEGSGGRDRRTAPRREIEVDIGIQSGTNFFTGFSQDISSGGLFVATYDMLPIGSRINVNFQLPEGPVLSLDGTVRWVRKYSANNPDVEPGMGIQFDDLSQEGSAAINSFMAHTTPIFYDND